MSLIEVLFPHLAEVHIEEMRAAEDGRVRIQARTCVERAACPRCGVSSSRVHSRYVRRLADVAIAGRPVPINGSGGLRWPHHGGQRRPHPVITLPGRAA